MPRGVGRVSVSGVLQWAQIQSAVRELSFEQTGALSDPGAGSILSARPMAACMASKMAVAPSRGALARKVSVKAARRTAIRVRAFAPAYDEVFDGNTGQMEKVLSQSVESVSAGGLEWSYRVGVPEEGTEAKPTKVLMVHGAGLNSFTYNKLSRELQKMGYTTFAPDMPGHGATSKPTAGFDYSAASYQSALEAFMTAAGIADVEDPVDMVVSGYITSQAALLLAAANPGLFRGVIVMNTPLGPGHKLPIPSRFTPARSAWARARRRTFTSWRTLATSSPSPRRPWPSTRLLTRAATAKAARAALEATVTKNDLKALTSAVSKAWSVRGLPKVRIVWGVNDKYLGDKDMYKWAEDVRATFDCIRSVGHMPQEDFPQEAAKFVGAYLESELKVSALGSVRLGKVTKDDDYQR